MKNKKSLNYIAGTFMVQANEAFLNGGGVSIAEDQNIVWPKFMWVNGRKVPYVSSQAWKRWLRNTLVEETKWPASTLRAVGWNKKGNTSKVAGMLNPIDYPEDDIFGYMFAFSSKDVPKELDEEKKAIIDSLPKEQIVRPATFLASLLAAIQTKSTISTDEAFIHLKDESTPLPYTTHFYNADLNAIFGIDLTRIGVFDNLEAHELDTKLIETALKENKLEIIKEKSPNKRLGIYRKKDLAKYRKTIVIELLKAISILRGGAKLAQFGVDVSPKILICVGLDFNAPILNNLFIPGNEKPLLDIELLKELIKDYSTRIITPIIIGVRKNYLENEEEVKKLDEQSIDGVQIKITTPLKIPTEISAFL
ncbi:MAG: hypothetical protein ACTSRG_22560 [Candidatus Helarchaeota archaeon]